MYVQDSHLNMQLHTDHFMFFLPTLNTIIILLTPHKDKIVFNVGDICKACLALVTATYRRFPSSILTSPERVDCYLFLRNVTQH